MIELADDSKDYYFDMFLQQLGFVVHTNTEYERILVWGKCTLCNYPMTYTLHEYATNIHRDRRFYIFGHELSNTPCDNDLEHLVHTFEEYKNESL